MQSVDNLHQIIHTRAPTLAETTLRESRETALVQDPMDALAAERDSVRRLLDQAIAERDAARATLAEAIADVRTRASCYLREPADASWHELVEALTRIYGDGETYDLLRAVTIHSQTGRRWSS